jgi:hypothetical protein
MSSSSSSLTRNLKNNYDTSVIVVADELQQALNTQKGTIHGVLRAARQKTSRNSKSFSGLKPIRAKLYSAIQLQNSTAAAALSASSPILFNATTFPEIASFGLVYDEVRILGFKLHFFPYVSTPATAFPEFTDFATSIQFDPGVANPTTVTQVLEESYNSGVMKICAGVNGLSNQSSLFRIPYATLDARAPKLAPINGDDCPGSAWFAVDASTAPTTCVITSYASALGTAGISRLDYYVELDCEFRLRT